MSRRSLLVDTNVWGAELDERKAALRFRFARYLVDADAAIAMQTVAELRYGALAAGWGPRRMASLKELLSRATVIPVDDELAWAHARLRATCRLAGHPLHDKHHDGDLWIAATAVAHGLPLISDDTVFVGVPGLTLISE